MANRPILLLFTGWLFCVFSVHCFGSANDLQNWCKLNPFKATVAAGAVWVATVEGLSRIHELGKRLRIKASGFDSVVRKNAYWLYDDSQETMQDFLASNTSDEQKLSELRLMEKEMVRRPFCKSTSRERIRELLTSYIGIYAALSIPIRIRSDIHHLETLTTNDQKLFHLVTGTAPHVLACAATTVATFVYLVFMHPYSGSENVSWHYPNFHVLNRIKRAKTHMLEKNNSM